LSPLVIHRIHGQVSDFLDAQAAAEHQHEHGPVSYVRDDPKSLVTWSSFRCRGSGLGKTDGDPGDGIGDRDFLLIDEILKKRRMVCRWHVMVFGVASLPEQMINIETYSLLVTSERRTVIHLKK